MSSHKTDVKKIISIIINALKIFLSGMIAGILLLEYLRNRSRPAPALYFGRNSNEAYDKEEV